jgi:S1-C subfamily serine protease
VLRLNDRPVTDRETADAAVQLLQPGERVHVRIVREGRLEDRVVEVGARDFTWVVPSEAPIPRPSWSPGGPGQQVLGLRWVAIPDDLRVAWGAPRGAGVLVARIDAGGPAAKAGVRVGDIVVRANGASVRDVDDVPYLSSSSTIRLEVLRRGASEPLRMEIPPAAMAPPPAAATPAPRAEEADRRRLEREIERLREEVRRLEAELERARKPE